MSVMHQSIPAAPNPPPPPGNCGAFAHIVSPGGSGISQPQGYPRAFDTTWFLTRDPNVDDFVGKDQQFVTDWLVRQGLDKLWRFLKVCFLDFMHFLLVYQATTWEITVYTLKRDLEIQRDYVFRVQNVCDDIPGVGHLPSSFIPTPGNLPPKTKKVLMPGG